MVSTTAAGRDEALEVSSNWVFENLRNSTKKARSSRGFIGMRLKIIDFPPPSRRERFSRFLLHVILWGTVLVLFWLLIL
jgi:hypothetical protein